MFETVHEAKIVGFPDGNILSLCPTMDLLVISMNKMSLWVFRLNGERIYSVNNRSVILHHKWSPNGKHFVLTGIDGQVKIYDTNTGDILSTFTVGSPIELIHWSKQDYESSELFEIDVIDHLPSSGDFTNFKALEYIVTTTLTSISLIFNNLIKFDVAEKNIEFFKVKAIDMFNMIFLAKKDDTVGLINLKIQNQQSLIPIVLLFTKIKSIVIKFNSILSELQTEFQQFSIIFDRYLSNYYDCLDSKTPPKPLIITSFTQILLTGLIPEKVVDYWINQLGDRGYKRLQKTGNAIYESIRNVVFKKLINYLEKLLVLLDQLKQLVAFNELQYKSNLGIKPDDIETIISDVKVYFKKLYKFIWDCNEEQKLFNVFLDWVKSLIDLLLKEKEGDEITGNLVDINSIDLINYFQFHLFNSKVTNYLKLDFSSTDVLDKSAETKYDLMLEIDSIIASTDELVFAKFETYFQSIVTLSEFTPLSTGTSSNYHMKLYGESGLVYTVDSNSVTLYKFELGSSSYSEVKVPIEEVIDHELYHDSLILLTKSSLCQCDLRTLFEEKVFKPYNTKALQSTDAKYLFTDNNRKNGCLFNANKKDYIIFQL